MLYYRRGQGKPTTNRAAAVKRTKGNAMKYVDAYNKLWKIGAIGNIMKSECKNGANPSMVKIILLPLFGIISPLPPRSVFMKWTITLI